LSNQPTTTGTVSQSAPSWQLPYQESGINQSQAQYNSVSSPTQLVAPMSTQQNQAITGITNLATNGTPEGNAANSYVTNTLNGQPANNPYLNSEFQLGANQVQNSLASQFAGSGANVLSSLPVQSDELNNLATQLYGGAYNTGVQQQESAAQLAPTLQTNDYNAQNALYNAGGAIQNQSQQYIQAPQTFLQNYLNQINQGLGTTQVTSQPTVGATTVLGGANLGSSLGSTVGSSLGGTTGGGIGSLLGALLGGYGASQI
jgi:hypothetical protein